MNRIRNTKAFTLIELVVVIVILGILAAIAAFAYQSFISSSRQSAVERTADQVNKTLAASTANKTTDTPLATLASTANASSDVTGSGAVVSVEGVQCLKVVRDNMTAYLDYNAAAAKPGQSAKTTADVANCPAA